MHKLVNDLPLVFPVRLKGHPVVIREEFLYECQRCDWEWWQTKEVQQPDACPRCGAFAEPCHVRSVDELGEPLN